MPQVLGAEDRAPDRAFVRHAIDLARLIGRDDKFPVRNRGVARPTSLGALGIGSDTVIVAANSVLVGDPCVQLSVKLRQ